MRRQQRNGSSRAPDVSELSKRVAHSRQAPPTPSIAHTTREWRMGSVAGTKTVETSGVDRRGRDRVGTGSSTFGSSIAGARTGTRSITRTDTGSITRTGTGSVDGTRSITRTGIGSITGTGTGSVDGTMRDPDQFSRRDRDPKQHASSPVRVSATARSRGAVLTRPAQRRNSAVRGAVLTRPALRGDGVRPLGVRRLELQHRRVRRRGGLCRAAAPATRVPWR